MNWLAKINLNTVVTRLGVFKSSLLLLALIAISFYSGYRTGNFYHSYQEQTLAQQKQRLDDLYAQHVEQIKRINTLEVELEVERIANQRSQITLKNMEGEHYQVKKQLAFYEKVMAPEKQADGLVIDQVAIYPTNSPHHYRFEVTLIQQKLKKRFAKGYIDLTFEGSLNKKPHKLNITKVSALTRKQLSFSFKYFQIIEGEFTLPANFVPEKIAASATLPKAKWQDYHRIDDNYLWQKVVQHPK